MKKYLLIVTALFLSSSLFAAEYSCENSRKYCKEIKSCAEAKYYLNQCGESRLDRDGDGIPCENICGKGKKKK
ncbi:excalibur calcium-binding domain-containing protein [Conservatibacter flavescens]|uniref:Cold-shock protein n=1 Tax=Conservatibacter flavescens TaxID=28161 RepID=A0A2M8S5Z9_9PAST|nr:excalibur calcium-binding domain-containing protein [Conservatibacter flavescens]PJG86577.1 cold-shock protein [Conservatibacter flavescens]